MAPFLKISSLFVLGVGVFVLTQAALPLVSYQIWEWTSLKSNAQLATPLIEQQNGFLSNKVLGVSIAQANQELTAGLPFTTRTYKPNYDSFTLTIPKLKINSAIVKVDGENPDRSLVLLRGMALPGEKGNVFIAGHSGYYRLFGPDDWYLSIFKNLNDLKVGDQIITTVQGQDFTYKVKSMKVVNPTDLSVLRPPDSNGRYISLMTCVPPGTFMKRLIVLGELQ